MKKVTTWGLMLALAAACITGCSKVNTAIESAAQQASSAIDSATATEDTSSLTDRYNAYVELYNQIMTDSVSTAIEYYFEDVADQEEFEVLGDSYTDYDLSEYDFEELEDAYAYAQKESEYADVDASVVALYPSMKKVMDLLNEAAQYGAGKNYLDDDFAKGAEIHAELYPALDEYYTLAGDFVDKFDALAEEEAQKELEDLKAEGYDLRYNMAKAIDLVKKMYDEMWTGANGDLASDNIQELDVTNITPLYEEYSAVLEELTKLAADKDQVDKEGFSSSTWIGQYVDAATDTKASLAEIMQRVKQGAPVDGIENMSDGIRKMTEGTFENFSSCYSDMINTYNTAIN